MNSVIIKPKNEILKNYVQYFLFFEKTNHDFLTYTTFPNSNLCLAIYKENKISYDNQNNLCEVNVGRAFTSRFYGFHKKPFQVNIDSLLSQICIIFQPSALRAFTKESYDELMFSDSVFDEIFSSDKNILEKIFEIDDFSKRANELEILLLKKLNDSVSDTMKEALMLINQNNSISINELSKSLKISEATLFRLFKNNLGQNPKSYLKTLRFRNVLNDLSQSKNSLTTVAYQNLFYDQAHFIKDFKMFSGFSPKKLVEKISVNQKDLTWIYNKD
ncbi:helix-turn-helix domain-containing protein [Epilithonimonas pallida]|uniref:Transcriptional regulator, AraC family n=1 Tax=Epilithonimonas pallida TaxID=373671 RepID=A0ABY1R6A1_9FLAO|nr:AraC family transcriptional regulator [Epilithonimonas pallida]SMP96151.1 transcriptional regulator, AraC family [Epilithonimonas pallida]